MQLVVFRSLWDIAEGWESAFPRIKASGYQGIENGLPLPADNQRFADLLQQYEFSYSAYIFTVGASVDDHLASFRAQVEQARSLNPKLINCHAGRDSWTFDESKRFFTSALQIAADNGVLVTHETHRGRILFNPWITRQLLDEFDGLKLCADLSHWVCVCERLIDDQIDIIRQCADHCEHIHARVGYEEGPQVPDPRAPEYRAHLEAHERWWGLIWAAQEARGNTVSMLCPEYGPPPYQHTLPYTNMPVANVWDICNWITDRQRDHFASRKALRATSNGD
jgi:hypothetical protein